MGLRPYIDGKGKEWGEAIAGVVLQFFHIVIYVDIT